MQPHAPNSDSPGRQLSASTLKQPALYATNTMPMNQRPPHPPHPPYLASMLGPAQSALPSQNPIHAPTQTSTPVLSSVSPRQISAHGAVISPGPRMPSIAPIASPTVATSMSVGSGQSSHAIPTTTSSGQTPALIRSASPSSIPSQPDQSMSRYVYPQPQISLVPPSSYHISQNDSLNAPSQHLSMYPDPLAASSPPLPLPPPATSSPSRGQAQQHHPLSSPNYGAAATTFTPAVSFPPVGPGPWPPAPPSTADPTVPPPPLTADPTVPPPSPQHPLPSAVPSQPPSSMTSLPPPSSAASSRTLSSRRIASSSSPSTVATASIPTAPSSSTSSFDFVYSNNLYDVPSRVSLETVRRDFPHFFGYACIPCQLQFFNLEDCLDHVQKKHKRPLDDNKSKERYVVSVQCLPCSLKPQRNQYRPGLSQSLVGLSCHYATPGCISELPNVIIELLNRLSPSALAPYHWTPASVENQGYQDTFGKPSIYKPQPQEEEIAKKRAGKKSRTANSANPPPQPTHTHFLRGTQAPPPAPPLPSQAKQQQQSQALPVPPHQQQPSSSQPPLNSASPPPSTSSYGSPQGITYVPQYAQTMPLNPSQPQQPYYTQQQPQMQIVINGQQQQQQQQQGQQQHQHNDYYYQSNQIAMSQMPMMPQPPPPPPHHPLPILSHIPPGYVVVQSPDGHHAMVPQSQLQPIPQMQPQLQASMSSHTSHPGQSNTSGQGMVQQFTQHHSCNDATTLQPSLSSIPQQQQQQQQQPLPQQPLHSTSAPIYHQNFPQTYDPITGAISYDVSSILLQPSSNVQYIPVVQPQMILQHQQQQSQMQQSQMSQQPVMQHQNHMFQQPPPQQNVLSFMLSYPPVNQQTTFLPTSPRQTIQSSNDSALAAPSAPSNSTVPPSQHDTLSSSTSLSTAVSSATTTTSPIVHPMAADTKSSTEGHQSVASSNS